MSIFSKLSRAKKAAKNHKDAQQGPSAETVDKPVPYRHVVTHAAIDALSGAPSSWREADRLAIKATNEKRKTLTRNSSGLSSTLPRVSSYGTASNYSYSRPMPPRTENRRSYGAHGGYYTNASGLTIGNPTFQPSRLASQGRSYDVQTSLGRRLIQALGVSPTQSLNEEAESSSSASSSRKIRPVTSRVPESVDISSELVELPYTAPAPQRPAPLRRDSTLLEQLHTNPTRKLGEAPLYTSPPPTLAKQPATAPTLIQNKKRSWGFGKRNSQAAAVAVH
jgi:hypothetical protein